MDDGSTDGTRKILDAIQDPAYVRKKCERFVWLGPQMDRLRQGERLEDILKREGVSLVVADTRYMANWTKFHFLFKDPPPWLTRLAEFGEGKEKILVYRFSSDT